MDVQLPKWCCTKTHQSQREVFTEKLFCQQADISGMLMTFSIRISSESYDGSLVIFSDISGLNSSGCCIMSKFDLLYAC